MEDLKFKKVTIKIFSSTFNKKQHKSFFFFWVFRFLRLAASVCPSVSLPFSVSFIFIRAFENFHTDSFKGDESVPSDMWITFSRWELCNKVHSLLMLYLLLIFHFHPITRPQGNVSLIFHLALSSKSQSSPRIVASFVCLCVLSDCTKQLFQVCLCILLLFLSAPTLPRWQAAQDVLCRSSAVKFNVAEH